MPTTLQQIPSESIIVLTITSPFNPLKDMVTAEQQFQSLAATIEGPIHRIIDVTGWDMQFSDMVNVLDMDTRGGSGADPRIVTVIVGSTALHNLAANSGAQKQYGARATPIFTSLDAALRFVRAQLVPNRQ